MRILWNLMITIAITAVAIVIIHQLLEIALRYSNDYERPIDFDNDPAVNATAKSFVWTVVGLGIAVWLTVRFTKKWYSGAVNWRRLSSFGTHLST
jgi:hypothetical protein